MAYAALVSLSQTTVLILKNAKYPLSDDEKRNITSIHEYVNFLLSFLEGCGNRLSSRKGRRIRDVANEAEDIIELFVWKQIQMKGRIVELSRAEFERQLAQVTEKIGLIAGEMMDEPPAGDSAASAPPSAAGSTAPAGKNIVEVIGLERDLLAMKDRLCGGPSSLQVVPIVGMGGIGKTTLAQNAYNNQLIIASFPVRVWVTLSQDYDIQNVGSTLMDSLKTLYVESPASSTDTARDRVYKTLKGRRYLIVLDDMWSTKAWDEVKLMFPNDDYRSRIVLTTRLTEVASYAASSHHEMSFMGEKESWDLLKQKVFGDSQDCPHELEEIGKEIVRSCGGLPLAVVLVGGILSTLDDRTQASWKEISEDVSSAVGGELEKILSLSYTHLPLYLRPCFLLIGGFP